MISLLRKNNINVFEIIEALLLGFAFAAAPHYINKGECYFTIGYFIVSIILGIIFIVSASIIRVLIKSNISKSYENRFVSFIYRIIWERNHPLLILTIIIFLLQLPFINIALSRNVD